MDIEALKDKVTDARCRTYDSRTRLMQKLSQFEEVSRDLTLEQKVFSEVSDEYLRLERELLIMERRRDDLLDGFSDDISGAV